MKKVEFVCPYYNFFICKNQRPSEPQCDTGGRLLELSFMLHSGMSWYFSFLFNVSNTSLCLSYQIKDKTILKLRK